METISNDNCRHLCLEITCNKEPVKFVRITSQGLKVILWFCEEHAEEWENNYLTTLTTQTTQEALK